MKLQGKKILITGAAGGLGSTAMKLLIKEGAKVIGIDKIPGPDELRDKIMIADLRSPEHLEKVVKSAIESLGGLDILINNAGVLELQDMAQPPGADSQEAIEVHLLGTWRVTSLVLPALLESGGRVVNVASLFAFVNAPFIGAYATTKRAVSAYSDILRIQLRGKITVATAYPGYMNTAIHDSAVRQGLSVERIVSFYLGNKKIINLEEPLEKAAKGLLRICAIKRIRNSGLTFLGTQTYFLARNLPWLVDAFISWRIKQLIKSGILKVTLDKKEQQYRV